jgi:pyruvate/2-oxoglutarate dehydrogenase complex dihydrolipoamide acyltransferase (E2) component
MPTPIHTPRVNNNDDTVRLTRVLVTPGAAVRAGDVVAEIETDKANFTVEADRDGYILSVEHEVEQVIAVGSVLFWVGASATEDVPRHLIVAAGPAARTQEPTLKAAQLLAKYGLRAAEVPASGERLSAQDVEAFVARRGPSLSRSAPVVNGTAALPTWPGAADRPAAVLPPGRRQALAPEERGMLNTVLWHRTEAVPGYVELQYDTEPWERAAADVQRREGLLLSPLLSLMAFRLARLAADNPRWNATIVGDEHVIYDTVNLGFTVQSETTLYLVVVSDAASLSCRAFLDRLGQLQRSAFARRLQPADLTGATIGFSSMARWKVTRHVPVLPPHTAIIVAHAAAVSGQGTLGATYDHRVLTGFDALSAIRALSVPEGLS